MEFAAGHELRGECALPAIEFLPESDGIFLVELAGADDELAVVAEAHTRVLGVGVGGKKGRGPEQRLERGIDGRIVGDRSALEKEFASGAICAGGALGDFGVEFIQGAQVVGRANIDRRIDALGFEAGEGICPIELLFVGEFVKRLTQKLGPAIDHGQTACGEDFSINGLQQPLGARLRIDAHDAPHPDIGGVIHEHFGPAIQVELIQHAPQ